MNQPLSRRAFVASLCAASSLTVTAQQTRKPNIVFVLADDLGINGLGCYGADGFKTPNIDALAQGGLRFANAYTAPLCGPSRALIMTGRYAFRTGATNQDATGQIKSSAETFLPQILKPAGYKSACVGKWGQLPLGPGEFGFDEYLQFKGSGTYWNTQEKGRKYTFPKTAPMSPSRGERTIPSSRHHAASLHMASESRCWISSRGISRRLEPPVKSAYTLSSTPCFLPSSS